MSRTFTEEDLNLEADFYRIVDDLWPEYHTQSPEPKNPTPEKEKAALLAIKDEAESMISVMEMRMASQIFPVEGTMVLESCLSDLKSSLLGSDVELIRAKVRSGHPSPSYQLDPGENLMRIKEKAECTISVVEMSLAPEAMAVMETSLAVLKSSITGDDINNIMSPPTMLCSLWRVTFWVKGTRL
ncbi:unnamed protein product [Arabis nemorensis]|uniref:Uncharacterized protein n=1 Tax=Arabis nemorensis TaxID=586526 RepID=A0A565AK71_9BRAS|nr:unnamed protein product [Arabis nemorensis]